MKRLTIKHPRGQYPICIGADLFADASLLQQFVHGQQVLLVTNDQVGPLYKAKISQVFSSYDYHEIILPDGEQQKTPATLLKIIDALATQHHHRDTTLIALGGGVIGDMTGFAAATYQRGVNFVQLPTSLLAQVDAAVGGKTAVNLPQGKNLWGAFHQPQAVIIDIDTLKTLPSRHLYAGLAEIIKAAIIADAAFFSWLEQNLDEIIDLQPAALTEAIQRACQIKADIVEADEREQSQRALLNLGHTFGHAIEQNLQYRDCLHGEAVAIGMSLATKLAVELNLFPADDAKRIDALLLAAHLPITLPRQLHLSPFIAAMQQDKKVLQNTLRLILPKKIGEAIIFDQVSDKMLTRFLHNQGLDD